MAKLTGLSEVDIQRMRDQLFFEGPERNRRLSRYWLLLPLAAVIASAGVVSDSTATVIVDLVAALATGAVGSVALARSDISDTLPGVAIAISLVPPLAVVGLTLESGAPRQSLGSFLLFVTNVAAILASGIVVMAFHRVHRIFGAASSRYGGAIAVIAVLLLVVIVPLRINSEQVDKTSVRQSEVQAVAERWANDAGWSVAGVTATGDQVLIEATGPNPAPGLTLLRHDLNAAGLDGLDVRVNLVPASYQPVPK